VQNNPGIPARHPIVMLRKSFRDLFTGLVILIFGANNVPFVYSLSQNKSCKEHPRLIGPCFNVHSRLSYYNGAPSLRLWPVGTHRLLGISEGRFALPGYDNVPSAVIARLANFENEMFADFTVCHSLPMSQVSCVWFVSKQRETYWLKQENKNQSRGSELETRVAGHAGSR
jgi:hypothetical protein